MQFVALYTLHGSICEMEFSAHCWADAAETFRVLKHYEATLLLIADREISRTMVGFREALVTVLPFGDFHDRP